MHGLEEWSPCRASGRQNSAYRSSSYKVSSDPSLRSGFRLPAPVRHGGLTPANQLNLQAQQ